VSGRGGIVRFIARRLESGLAIVHPERQFGLRPNTVAGTASAFPGSSHSYAGQQRWLWVKRGIWPASRKRTFGRAPASIIHETLTGIVGDHRIGRHHGPRVVGFDTRELH
jgi:hypothetical protein